MEKKRKQKKPNQRVDFCKGKYLFTIFTIILVDKQISPHISGKDLINYP